MQPLGVVGQVVAVQSGSSGPGLEAKAGGAGPGVEIISQYSGFGGWVFSCGC
jgi:hypothetical protein